MVFIRMISFVSFVLGFEKDDSAIGDVARDMVQDTMISKRWGYSTLIKHLRKMNATDAVFNLLEEANLYYNRHNWK